LRNGLSRTLSCRERSLLALVSSRHSPERTRKCLAVVSPARLPRLKHGEGEADLRKRRLIALEDAGVAAGLVRHPRGIGDADDEPAVRDGHEAHVLFLEARFLDRGFSLLARLDDSRGSTNGLVSRARRRDVKPVAGRIGEVTLPTGETLLIDGHSELRRYVIDVSHIQLHEGVGWCVAAVLREIEPNVASRHRHEQWKTRLELVLPLLLEAEPAVPVDGASCIFDAENRNDVFDHHDRL